MAVSEVLTQQLTTAAVIATFQYRVPVPAFFRDNFFGSKVFTDAETVIVDTKKGGKRLAPAVLPLEGSVVERREPFKRAAVEMPIFAPSRQITLREATTPGMGETLYNYRTIEQRIADMLASDEMEMDDEISRTEEWMAAQLLFTGQIPINYRTKTDVVIDYGFTNTLAPSGAWTGAGLPLQDLRGAQNNLASNSYAGDIAVMGPQTMDKFMNNQSVLDTMKNWPSLQTIATLPGTPQYNGVTPGPRLISPAMQLYSYAATYTNDRTVTPMVPEGYCLVIGAGVQNKMAYGLVTQIEQEDNWWHYYSLERVPKLEVNVNKNFLAFILTSRPLPIPMDVMSWALIGPIT
jgi:Phage major capsid protein E